MSSVEHPAERWGPVRDLPSVGVPGADGRWQPTRAGAVNSWAWSDEVLVFADGWMTLTGPNGSGKSLTASMLVTLLLDADTSQTALSVTGKAAGTLTSRHTDRNEREDRTGTWWVEYGMRDAVSKSTSYLTTGLWLRSVSGNLQRAFFLTPGRIGDQLVLTRAGDPVRIDDLASQLAETGGELFTSAAPLRSKAARHLAAVGDEPGYRHAVRQRLFAPLDEVQFEALMGVLRSLRSLRTAEAIPPAQMRAVLTEALPALDPDRLIVIGEAMERISELETQLADMRDEAKQLATVDKRYQRYVSALVEVEAARLTAANTDFDAQARQTRDATEKLEAARRAQDDAAERLRALDAEISVLEGRRDATDAALRDHAGAELPQREQRAAELAQDAKRAEGRADEAAVDAQIAAERSTEAAVSAEESMDHLTQLLDELRAASREVGAGAALERIVEVTGLLTAAGERDTPTVDLQHVCATPLAWVASRVEQVDLVAEALHAHADAQRDEQSAADELRRAERDEIEARQRAENTTRARQEAEADLVEQISRWATQARHFDDLPAELVEYRDSADEHLEPDLIEAWMSAAVDLVRGRINVTGHHRAADTAAALRDQAERARDDASKEQREAEAAAAEAAAALAAARAAALAEAAADQRRRASAEEACTREIDAARHQFDATERAAVDAAATADRTAINWARETHRWRAANRFLTTVALPDPAADVDPAAVRLAVEQAHAQVKVDLELLLNESRRALADARAAADEVEGKLLDARRAAPVPTAPPWRDRHPGQGVPLWALVDFAEGLPPEQANLVEGALLVSGLLDALVTSDGAALAGDLVITAGTPVPGRTLADLLRPEPSPAVPPDRVEALLRSVPVPRTAEHGQLTTGPLTAAAPEGYRAEFIGRTTRERRRLRLVAELEAALARATSAVDAAGSEVSTRKSNVLAAAAERDSLPDPTELVDARRDAARLRADAEEARHRAAERTAEAQRERDRVLALLTAAAERRTSGVAAVKQRLSHAEGVARATSHRTDEATRTAEQRRVAAAQAADALSRATEAQREADAERASFPDLGHVRRVHLDEDREEGVLRRAARQVLDVAERHRQAGAAVHEALRRLNQAATLPDGRLLPAERTLLQAHRVTATRLGHQVELWEHAATRATELARHARATAASARNRAAVAARDRAEADAAKLKAIREASTVAEARELYGAEYQQLTSARTGIVDDLNRAKKEHGEVLDRGQQASNAAAAAQATLDGIAPQREAAERRRDACVRQIGRLVEERFTSIPDELSNESGKPAHLTAALTWARRLLSDHTGGTDRLETLRQARGRALSQVESSARTTSTALARFDRQVVLASIEGTEWRRAVVADPGASRGEDLPAAVEKLTATAAQLEDDLRDDVKRTLKTGLFTQLRRDILVRREAAQELVRQIRRTLAEVRTGVANVGVQVEWTVREDEDARRMVELISQPQSDEIFEDMYTVLRQRMNERAGDSWKERVAHTFDYRSWHDWTISVTHSSFSDQNEGKFREVTARSNPLESLSTGERRLATMLPLLAAAWSMYSGPDYRGPRWVSIDEIDAAFDEPNLRQVLALLRSWAFDVLATAPFITPMIKKETGRVVVHQLVTAGKRRVTVPWLWEGHGEPEVLTLDLSAGGGEG
ncbi:SbcC/MukB-like Walker B domain-containing protein [Streptoalloteichus hindustanus]|uniref:Putative exonuclease SbcCD, C subunit n=1 Tax=Streptoalloteichus hindustanus TaxID=2017 RepID=A0A1M5D9V4_STRHI|nr:SbcC/MukB-like Walker B domain-containing protein [Streptoalloteichus hindustanus]SHF63452.1 Putative exonuclease SbcCD, C subunit [Streptoalloteichus hindustanus]